MGHKQQKASDWVSEREADLKMGIPRELLLMMSGEEVPIPSPSADQEIRRRVLLEFWTDRKGMKWPYPPDGASMRYPKALIDEFNKCVHGPHKWKDENERARIVALWCYFQFVKPASDDEFLQQLWADLTAGPPKADEVKQEWDRYELTLPA